MRKFLFPCLFILASSACESCQPGLVSPSPANLPDVRQVWSPYVGIHAYGGGESQKPYLLDLKKAGMLQGVRIEALELLDVQQFAVWLNSQNIEVLGLFGNKHLRNPNVIQIFDQMVRQNPTVRVWEIGNEVNGYRPENPDPGLNMPISEYMPIFKNIFYYAKTNHPGIKVIPQSDDLGGMLDLGLDQIIRDGLAIVTVHFYESEKTLSLEVLQKQIARVPGTTQVWITETGDNVWPTQISYAQTNYPRYRNTLRAIRIYWYVLSECPYGRGDYSLIAGLPDQCQTNPPTPSPLFAALTNGGGQ